MSSNLHYTEYAAPPGFYLGYKVWGEGLLRAHLC